MSGILMASVGNSYGSAPVNTVAPAVTGTATVGQTLTTTNGTWTGAPAPTFTYQWQRSAVNISGATSSTYVLVAADYANTIRCVVTATNSVAPSGVSANSNSTASVAGNAPVNTVAPAVTGTATVGQTLSTTNGTWTGVPTPTFTYQWQRVTTNISGATSSTYALVVADAGSTIRCVVTATNAVSAVSANSNSTASVAATVPGAPTIGTATATGTTTATVSYTAPASNGGATITSYTATSSPSGITGTLSQAGSGTITVSGLAAATFYTFTVTATNSAGTSAASAASNSIATQSNPFNFSSSVDATITTYRTLGVDTVNNQLYVTTAQTPGSELVRYNIAGNGALSGATSITPNTGSVPTRGLSFRPPSSDNAAISGYLSASIATYTSRGNMFSSPTLVNLGSTFESFNAWGNVYTGSNVLVVSGANVQDVSPFPSPEGLVIVNVATSAIRGVNLTNSTDAGQTQTTGLAFDPYTNRLYVGFFASPSIINVYTVNNPTDYDTISFTYIERVTTSLSQNITAIGCNANYIWYGGEGNEMRRSPRS